MATFLYRGILENGKQVYGAKEYSTRGKMDEYLKKKAFTDFYIYQSETPYLYGKRFVSKRELSIFCKEIEILLKSELDVMDCFLISSKKIKNNNLKKAVVEIESYVSTGELSLTDTIMLYEHIFGKKFTSIVSACDDVGDLQLAFRELSEFFEKDYHIDTKIKSLWIHPIVLVLMLGVVVALFNSKVIPLFYELVSSTNTDNLFFLELLNKINHYFTEYLSYIVFFICIVILAVIFVNRTKKGKLFFNKITIHIPFYSKVIKHVQSYKFFNALSIMLKYKLPLTYSFEQAVNSLDNEYVKNELNKSLEDIKKGQNFVDSISVVNIFPEEYMMLLSLGEENNNLPSSLDKVVDILEADVHKSIDDFSKLLEPVISIVMLGITISVLLSVLMPVIQLINTL
ncbi:MAG: type II secretion system F family protein [Lachnospirales bacterium]